MNIQAKDWKAQFTPHRYAVTRWNSTKFAIVDRQTNKPVVTAPTRHFLIEARDALNRLVVS